MFDVPFLLSRRDNDEAAVSGYECIWCNYRAQDKCRVCPQCRRLGFAPVGVVKGMLIMAGLIFTLFGGGLAYVTFWVVSERLVDDRLGREGTPWVIILTIFFGCVLCLFSGISSISGKKSLLQLMIWVGVGGRIAA